MKTKLLVIDVEVVPVRTPFLDSFRRITVAPEQNTPLTLAAPRMETSTALQVVTQIGTAVRTVVRDMALSLLGARKVVDKISTQTGVSASAQSRQQMRQNFTVRGPSLRTELYAEYDRQGRTTYAYRKEWVGGKVVDSQESGTPNCYRF